MSDGAEFDAWPEMGSPFSKMPSLDQFAATKAATKAASGFDPHAVMVKRNAINKGEIVDDTPQVSYPEEDVNALRDFCAEVGILGVNFKGMNPKLVLQKLKAEFGANYNGVPMENRTPFGFEKMGTKNSASPNYPFQGTPSSKKNLLHG